MRRALVIAALLLGATGARPAGAFIPRGDLASAAIDRGSVRGHLFGVDPVSSAALRSSFSLQEPGLIARNVDLEWALSASPGDAGRVVKTRHTNAYAAFLADPVNNTDPMGTETLDERRTALGSLTDYSLRRMLSRREISGTGMLFYRSAAELDALSRFELEEAVLESGQFFGAVPETANGARWGLVSSLGDAWSDFWGGRQGTYREAIRTAGDRRDLATRRLSREVGEADWSAGGAQLAERSADISAAGEKLGAEQVMVAGTIRSARAARTVLGEGAESAMVNETTAYRAGLNRAPRHHIFPQEHRPWFEARGFDIDRYTLELSEGTHSAVHTMGWNERMMARLYRRERAEGRLLTAREILQEGALMRREMELSHVKAVPYGK